MIIDVPTPDGTADAYLAGDSGPGVLLHMDALGMRPQIHAMADRLAAQGYVVLAPHVFWREGRAPLWDTEGDRAAMMEKVRPAMERLTTELALRDAGAWLDHLGTLTTGPVGITGYCMGGGLALRTAAAFPGVAAAGAFHAGRLVNDQPDSVHRSLEGLSAEVYLGFADQDASMPAEDIAALEQVLTDEGVTYTSEVYAGAAHGYTMADMEVYDEAAAERHWVALLALLDRTLR